MNRAYEGDETRQLAVELGYVQVVPPTQNWQPHGTTIARLTNAGVRSKACYAG